MGFLPRTRTITISVGLAVVLAAGVLAVIRDRSTARPVRLASELSLGARFADSLERVVRGRQARDVSGGEAMALLYLERLRLGVGSPFRLIDYALRDPLVPAEMRRRVADAILARSALGDAYVTPSAALDLIAPRNIPGMGVAHRQFIDSVLEQSENPRSAEVALRMAYDVGVASGVVSHRASAVATAAIAQARDRALAMRDVASLLKEARRQRMEALDLVPVWRATRRFDVERPLSSASDAAASREAVELLPQLAARLDSLGPVAVDDSVSYAHSAGVWQVAATTVARRFAPPQAPITVTMASYSSFVIGMARSVGDRAARATFVNARTEESLVAEWGRMRASIGASSEAALALLNAAVAMRPYAQERAWLPGDPGVAAIELQSRLGLAALTFDDRVPASWRPYYTRMLEEVVADLTTVFPGFDVTGLSVRFGESPLADRALALHDPGSRTVYFPLATGAGAMAHELAHDLDWQAARRTYGVRGGYRTDRSVRQYRDDFSATVRRLASARRPRRDSPSAATPEDRPTEAFARGVDWFVASALAHRGRLNGYLSSVQDELLTGYASATAPRSGAPEGDATLNALREIAAIDPSIAEWYDTTYGSGRHLGVADAVRRTLIAPLPRLDVRYSPSIGVDAISGSIRMMRASEEASGAWTCLLQTPALAGRDAAALGSAMRFAAEGRAGGLARRWGDYARGVPEASWRFRALGGAPWEPVATSSMVRELRDAILWRAARVDDGRVGNDLVEHAVRRATWDRCATDS
ncbi:MAG: hypothetical protein ABIZ91_19535 [Gemmatimonadaceae bacterium]